MAKMAGLAFPQTITLHFKHLSSVRVSKYVFDEDLKKVTVTFQLQSDKTRAYREYSWAYMATRTQIDEGAASMIKFAYENAWTLYHEDMLAFVAAEAVKPGSNELFQVPTYT
jgi:hypothetical protein